MPTFKFDHIHLRTSDPEATVEFFENVFGAEVTRSVYPEGTYYPGQPRITMQLGGQRILLAPRHPDHETTPAPKFPYYGLEHFALGVDDVDAAAEELKAKGANIVIGPLTLGPGSRIAFIEGPDGVMVELVQR
ncbi:MAG: VOC family protein [Methyloligellaceae bacterium]